MYDVLIIGGGPAGMAAAIYCARYKLKCAVVTSRVGGTILEAHLVENYPGFASVSGIELSKKFKEHAQKFGVEFIEQEVVSIKKNKEFLVNDKEGKEHRAKSLILAMGTERKRLKIPGEEKYNGKGVSYCYACDGPLFKDKIVGVVGGANAAAIAALMLADYAKKVYIIYRKQKIRSDPISVEAVEKNKKITIINNSNVIKINGKGFVESVDLDTGKNLKLDGLFIEIGVVPLVTLVKDFGVKRDGNFIDVDSEQKTNVEGVFAAGDVTNATKLKQIVTAASQGAIAALGAFKHLKTKK